MTETNSQELNSGRLFELSGAYWQSCILHTSVKLDLFTKIGEKCLTCEDIAQKLEGNTRSVTMFLNALVALKLLIKTGHSYSNTLISAAFLSKDSTQYIGYGLLHHHDMMNSWTHLDRAIKTGVSVRNTSKKKTQAELKNFFMRMFHTAMTVAPLLVKKINLSNRTHLLDLGGGPGTFAIQFCLNNPQLKATVCDLPSTMPFAKRVIEKFNLIDRVDFKCVDYLTDDIPGNYDIAWLSHILHQEGPDDAQNIINKAVSSLNPGGMIIIHEFILNNTMDSPFFPAIFSLIMLMETKTGQSYSEEQIRNMLHSAGVKNIKRIPFDSPNESGIILGVI